MMNQQDKKLLKKINEIVKLLNEIDDENNNIAEQISRVDCEQSDWLHLIENSDLSNREYSNVARKIKALRKMRRSLKNEQVLLNTYSNNISKLIYNNQRDFFVQKINATAKQLDSEYKNRIITEDDIKNVLKIGKKKISRRKSDEKR